MEEILKRWFKENLNQTAQVEQMKNFTEGQEAYRVDLEEDVAEPIVVVTEDGGSGVCFSLELRYDLDICEECRGMGCEGCANNGFV